MKTETPSAAKKIMVLGHDASRTGAPIFLLHFTHWLQSHGGMEIEIVLKNGGPLLEEFQKIAPTTVLQPARAERAVLRLCALLRCPPPGWLTLAAKLRRHLRRRPVALVYANTVAVAEAVAALEPFRLPVVWHVHELPFCVNTYGGGQPFRAAARSVGTFIAAAECVKQGLMANSGIAAEKIRVVHEFAPPEKSTTTDVATNRAAVRTELNLPPDAFVAGMCGSVGWRKGVDWFLATAKHLAMEFAAQDIHLLWIGAGESELVMAQVNHDLRAAGLAARVKFIGVKANSRHYLAALDAFLLSSREDPFPLVMLEAASLGLPVVCFADSGGGPEFVGTDAGVIVGYADTRAAAQALVELREQPERRARLGATAREKVCSRYTLEIQAPKILQLMKQAAA